MAVAKKKTPLVQWVEEAMAHASMSQSDLARALQARLRTDFDRSKVYKIVTTGTRKVSAEEMLAIEEVTGFPAPAALRDAPNEKPGKVSQVPLLDTVTAGKLRSPSSQIPVEDVPLLAFADLGRGDFFALKVDGDSMDRVSPDGSVIVVNQADRTLVSGKAYVVSQRGEATFKLWRADPPRFAPYSTNPLHEPIFVKSKADAEKMVVGRVKRTVLDL
jgi:SOS-response transcriptional repressor LexA